VKDRLIVTVFTGCSYDQTHADGTRHVVNAIVSRIVRSISPAFKTPDDQAKVWIASETRQHIAGRKIVNNRNIGPSKQFEVGMAADELAPPVMSIS
jgi:hypothetical protein